MEHFRSGFLSLYTTFLEETSRVPRHDVLEHVQLFEKVKDSVGALVTLVEIKDAL